MEPPLPSLDRSLILCPPSLEPPFPSRHLRILFPPTRTSPSYCRPSIFCLRPLNFVFLSWTLQRGLGLAWISTFRTVYMISVWLVAISGRAYVG